GSGVEVTDAMNGALRFRSAYALVCSAVLLAVSAGGVRAASAVVTRVSAVETAQGVELSVVASAPIRYELRQVQSNWIVIDVSPAALGIPAGTVSSAGHVVTKVRVGQFQSDVVRVVVEMVRPTPFRVTASADRMALLVGIGAPTSAIASGGVGPSTAAQAPPQAPAQPQVPQDTTIGFKSTAVLPQPTRPQTPPAQQTAPTQTAPAQPAPAQIQPAQRVQSVVPGKAIGPVRLGMHVQEVVAALGQPMRSQTLSDGTTAYEWFGPPKNSGLGVRTTPAGVVYRVWIINDAQYVIQDRVHVGTTENDARAALGEPSRVLVDASHGLKTLTYPSVGLWVVIQTDTRYAYYGQVFEIGVTTLPEPTAGR
ncbi:MAG TPA: AMIN domain-containing protein, partial [bacterium]|nr:AMIN domain-containing protein [bacterium]